MVSGGAQIASTVEGGNSSTALLIESEIQRYAAWRLNRRAATLKFAEDIERHFEVDTRAARMYELRLTLSLSVGFYLATTVLDSVFVPDLGITGLVMRICAAQLLLFFIFAGAKLSYRHREMLITFTATVAVIVLATIPAISSSPFSPFAFMPSILAMIYANTTFPLRFKYACIFSIACCGVIIFEIFLHPTITFDLFWTSGFMVVLGAVFSVITSYRAERSVRLNYLLSTREALRLSLLAADREILTTLSNTDALTGLLNRRHFDRQSAAIFANPLNAGKEVALLFIDVDYFKQYNDYYGHPVGDDCLREVAAAISGALRGTNDLTARYGGEEFAVLLFDIKQAQVELIAERVCRAVSAKKMQHFNRIDGVKVVTISVGVACGIVDEGCTIDGLIKTADRALYTAKRGGRNRVEFSLSEAA